MSAINIAFAIVIVVAAFYQLWVSVLVINAPEYEPSQKYWQLTIMWLLLPLLATAFVHAALRSERMGIVKRDPHFIRNDEGGGNNAG